MSVFVSLAAATICFAGGCHPALIGSSTAAGDYSLRQRFVASEGYGGDVLMFEETTSDVFAIHRVWTGRPAENRVARLASGSVAQRRDITGGCINVTPAVYAQLLACCGGAELVIE